ncbi:MAG TPA: phosphate/phosphite/phosphonate ABC transporter substrate-binding protein [Stellaceae bacterium]|nr:phosphate/phosphite/phosphonate ABC transporter substrate-binding protein [Stellaceae bacterium]
MRPRSAVVSVFALAAALAALAPVPAVAAADDCPNGGVVRFGVEPYEANAKLTPIYDHIGQLIAKKLGCDVKMQITTNYNAEIEAMRNDKLELGEFGPLGYVLAHQVAKAEAVATFGAKDGKAESYTASIVTWPGSPVQAMKDLPGHSFAFSDPASTSGHLYPAYAMRKNGIDPDKDVKGFYAGSHGASFEAIRNHKVDAGELNSQEIAAATIAGSYKEGDYITLWKSDAIPIDPIAVRGNLPEGFKARVTTILQTLDLSELSADDLKIIGSSGARFVVAKDGDYNIVRDLVETLHIDLAKLD